MAPLTATHTVTGKGHYLVIFWLVCAAMLLPSTGEAGPRGRTSLRALRPAISFSAIGPADGLPNGTVNAIVRDRTGYMWFATLDGLCRYNGYEVEVFKHDPLDSTTVGDKAVAIGALLVDRTGTLWIGTYSAGLDRFDPATGHFVHYRHDPSNPKSLSGNSIKALFEDRKGTFWVGSLGGGLDRMTGDGTFEHFRHDSLDRHSLSDNSVTCIAEDSAGALWVGTREGGVNRLDPERRHFVAYRNVPGNTRSLTQGEVWSVCADVDSSVWVGTVNGLNRWDKTTGDFTRLIHLPSVPGSLSHNFVYCLRLDPRHGLWVGTFGGGLDQYQRETGIFTHHRQEPGKIAGLRSNLIRTIYIDPSSSAQIPSLWIGLEGEGVAHSNTEVKGFGVCRHDPDVPGSLPEGIVNAICEDERGVIWIGTMNGLCRFDSIGGGSAYFTRVPTPASSTDGPGNNQVTSLLEDSFGLLWIGKFKGGLDCLDRHRTSFRHFRADPRVEGSLSNNSVNVIYEDRGGIVWIGTQEGLNRYDRRNGRFVQFRHERQDSAGLRPDQVRAITETRDGMLWIGTETSGLRRFDPGTAAFTAYRNDPRDSSSLSNDRVYALHEGTDGSLWIGTSDGLNRMGTTPGRFDRFTERNGLISSYVRAINGDDDGNLWLNTSRGLTRFHMASGAVHTYNVDDGLQGDDLSGASYRNRAGELMVGGNNGFNVFDPQEIVDNAASSSVVLTSFSIFDKPAPLGRPISVIDTIHLAYTENFFSFGFASLDFTSPAKHAYAFRLEGFDPDWVRAGTRRFAYYTNVGPGEYLFQVKGANAGGTWSERAASVRVIVAPPFWQTWWFISLAALALAGAVAALYNYRVSKLLEMERMRVRISSDLHDDIGSNLSSIALIADMVHHTLPEGTGERDHLQDVSRTARHTADALKDIVWIISPSHERLDDIVLRMKDGAAKLLTGIDYTFDCPVDGLSEHLTMEFRRNLLLMYKETLNNIAKYARATHVTIAVAEEQQMLRMTITDDGVGFDENTIVPGNGLRNLRQRAATLGGNVSVRSAPGQGTVVEFHVRIP